MLSQSSSGGAIRDKAGKIIQSGEYQSAEAPSGRVQPDRRWFGACSLCTAAKLRRRDLYLEALPNS